MHIETKINKHVKNKSKISKTINVYIIYNILNILQSSTGIIQRVIKSHAPKSHRATPMSPTYIKTSKSKLPSHQKSKFQLHQQDSPKPTYAISKAYQLSKSNYVMTLFRMNKY